MASRAIDEHAKLGDFFDRRYRAFRENPAHFAFSYGRKKIDDLLIETLNQVPPGGAVLDVGCGTGEQVARCAELGFAVSGVEPAAELRQAARQANPEAKIVDGLATRLPFASESFDLVISIEVLRYLPRPEVLAAYEEMLRVTRPGGRIFVTLVNRWALDGYYFYHRGSQLAARLTGRPGPLHCDFTTPGRVRRDLTSLGASGVRSYGAMLAPLRPVYKIRRSLGAALARRLDRLDDAVSRQRWHAPLGAHLVSIIRR